jgi:Kef-type K+ transport system membrane component KefB
VGPYALNLISDVHHVQHLAELGVVFLLFTIGLELSLERLQSMAKYVFGMGAAQVRLWGSRGAGGGCRGGWPRLPLVGEPNNARPTPAPPTPPAPTPHPPNPTQTILTLLGVASLAMSVAGLPGPSAIILGGALAMSTTAVAIQVRRFRVFL